MNDLQRCSLRLLQHFIEICEKLDLTYYLVCGSALGAAKYQGFIPWDDDIDVALPRRDYEIFLSQAPSLLPEHIFLQNYRSDPAFPHLFSKLRDSNTTLIEKSMAHLDIHHGIYIDVFPLDGYPKEQGAIESLRAKKKAFNRRIYCALRGGSNWKSKLRGCLFRFLGYHKHTHRELAQLESLVTQYSPEESEIWGNHGNWQGEREYAPRRQYGLGVAAKFEGLDVVIPENYDAYLTQKYGDWRSDPPPEKQVSHHQILFYDTEHSYLERPRK